MELFYFFRGGCPFSRSDQLYLVRRAQAAPWSDNHKHFSGCLHELVSKIKANNANNSSYRPGPITIEEMCENAKFVNPERMSLPAEAGILDPRQFLKGDFSKLLPLNNR